MPLILSDPLIQEFILEKSDKLFPNPDDPSPTLISVKKASNGDVEARGDLFSKFTRTFQTDGSFSIEQEVTMDDVRRKEVFLTMTACNITKKDKTPLFRFEGGKLVNEAEFRRAWAVLPPETAEEIHECVLKVNKIWSNEGEVQLNKE